MSEFILSNYDSYYGHRLGVVDSNRIKGGVSSIFKKNSLYFSYTLFCLILYSYLIGLCLYVNKTYTWLYNNSTYKDLPSAYRSREGTRIGLHVNMDDKTLHFFHDGKFSSYLILILLLLLLLLLLFLIIII
jgi:hypothetical protein